MSNHPIFKSYTKNALQEPPELPFVIKANFEALFNHWEDIAADDTHHLNSRAVNVLKNIEHAKELRTSISDYTILDKYEDELRILFSAIFPEMLALNEIKVAALPFNHVYFNPTQRLKNILSNTDEESLSLDFRNMNTDMLYIYSCVIAIGYLFNTNLNFNRPTFWDIRDEKTGLLRHYRVLFNADYVKLNTIEKSPDLTEEDLYELMDNFDNIDLWKEKIPPNSFEFEGFLVHNMFDVTNQEAISLLKDILIRREGLMSNGLADSIRRQIRKIFGLPELEVGFIAFNSNTEKFENAFLESWVSLSMGNLDTGSKTETFCNYSRPQLLNEKNTFIARDVDKAYEMCPHQMFENLNKQGIKSYFAIPFYEKERLIGVLEIGSPVVNALNSITAIKLEDIIPLFDIAIKRAATEFENELEAIIQEQCTAIHPSVKWKFLQEAEKVLQSKLSDTEMPIIGDINFPNVIPLFGQIDIKGSSLARNKAIQKDLVAQLKMAKQVMEAAIETEGMILYDAIRHQIQEHLESTKDEILAGDEARILSFLKEEVYPAFKHLESINDMMRAKVKDYESHIDSKLGVIYQERKDYEDTVNQLNQHLSDFLSKEQEKAQQMFPHYFEKYKTDGVEFNMYVGSSITKDKKFDEIYLQNLRLWQLKIMIELENEWFRVKDDLPMPLEVASMILIQSNPMSIRFRSDEKKFDVDGAYNTRYEIIKKRIDKAHIKNTEERLTQPGKLAIVYTQEEDAEEYIKYIHFLQSQDLLGPEIERLELDDVQGAAGLKALRITVKYRQKFTSDDGDELSRITLEDILRN